MPRVRVADPPHLLKVVGPLAVSGARRWSILDADMIVTRAARAAGRRGRRDRTVLAVADRSSDRFDERWGDLLGLGELRRQPYVNSGFLVVPDGSRRAPLRRLWRMLRRTSTSTAR